MNGASPSWSSHTYIFVVSRGVRQEENGAKQKRVRVSEREQEMQTKGEKGFRVGQKMRNNAEEYFARVYILDKASQPCQKLISSVEGKRHTRYFEFIHVCCQKEI